MAIHKKSLYFLALAVILFSNVLTVFQVGFTLSMLCLCVGFILLTVWYVLADREIEAEFRRRMKEIEARYRKEHEGQAK